MMWPARAPRLNAVSSRGLAQSFIAGAVEHHFRTAGAGRHAHIRHLLAQPDDIRLAAVREHFAVRAGANRLEHPRRLLFAHVV